MRRPILFVVMGALVAATSTTVLWAQNPTAPPATTPAGQRGDPGAGGAAAPGRGRGFAPVVIGPQAPVPPEVAIPRPTPAELAEVNAAVKKFIDSDNSSTKPLLRRFESLLMLQPPRLNVAATYTQTVQRQGPRHEGFIETAKQGGIDLLLDGDSITDWWVQGDANTAMFDKYFGAIKTANFAIAGDTTQGVLWGLKNGEGQGFQPKAVMLMIGTNNTAANTAPEIAEGIGAVVLEMRKDFPDAKILLLAIFPRSTPGDPVRDKIADVNKIIGRLDDGQHVFYMDIGAKFLDDQGRFLPDSFRADNLHPQAKGYDIWGEAVRAKLNDLLKGAPTASAQTAAPVAVGGARAGGPPPTGAPFDPAKVPAGLPAPKTWTAQEDHQNMVDQLGIKALRPGPSGNEQAPNHANYDEAAANPYPNLPDVLTVKKNGKKVTSASMWAERRKEIVEDFDREVLGRVPKNVPKVAWTVTRTVDATVGGHAVIGRQLTGHVDNSAFPAIDVDIQMTLVTPKDAKGPVPVMMMFGGGRGLPGDPPPAGFGGRGGARPGGAPAFVPPLSPDPPATEQLIADGWGYASINPASIQADNGAGLTRGIVGLVNKGQPRKPDDWGSLRAWAWGASRGLDYLETDKTVDAKRVGIEGVSRYGKAALVTMAYDTRFAVVLIGSSGEGGAKLHRRNWGEAVENLTATGEYHWMAGNFLKYGASDASFGSKNAGDIPVDAHELIALCAPRLTFVSYGVPEKGDAKWLDHQGSFMAAIAAQPVFRLLGAKDLGRSDDYRKEKMPAVNTGLLDGQLAWRQHDGGHTDGPNWKYFIPWADKFLKHTTGGA